MVHGVEELILVDETPNEEVNKAEEENEERAGQDAIDSADDEYKDGLREKKPVGEDGGLDELGVVSGGFGADKVDGVEGDAAEFKKAEGQEAETLEDNEVGVELG